MAKAFAIARGVVKILGPYANTIIEGRVVGYDDNTRIIPSDGSVPEGLPVHDDTVTFNTGYVDKRGTEIFEGDYLRLPLDPTLPDGAKFKGDEFVNFNEDIGAFESSVTYSEETTTSLSDGGRINGFFTGTRETPLTREKAATGLVTGNLYYAIYGIDAPEIVDDETEEAPFEIDATSEDFIDGDSYADDLRTQDSYDAATENAD